MKQQRVYNFSPGPCILPQEVYAQAAAEMSNYKNTGLSVFELSHRSADYDAIHMQCRKDLRTFLEVPSNYKILVLQGGATLQYAAIVKNLLRHDRNGKCKGANYLQSGLWSSQCINDASKSFTPNIMANGESTGFTKLPDSSKWNIDQNASYVHYCQNETVHGYEFKDGENNFPFHLFGDMTVVCDMSSDIGSRKVDWNKYGVVYAGAQKNLGAAGAAIVIIREDLIGTHAKDTTYMHNWEIFDKSPSGTFNTPATYPVYITGLNIAHMIKQGGLNYYIDLGQRRADLLYNFLDNSRGFYNNYVDKRYRSNMNCPFRIRPDEGENDKTYTRLELIFVQEAAQNGLVQLKGHTKNPGIRISMYNALPYEGAVEMVAFLEKFQRKYDDNGQNVMFKRTTVRAKM